MEAFKRIGSGVESLDLLLDNIRLGDNVVFQISKLEEYKFFVNHFVRQCNETHRKLVYIRFATHEPLVDREDAIWYEVNPSNGFESFTIQVHNIIEELGRGVCYIFDCLSDLQVAWAADLMMGNFFGVTCPYLFTLDTVAFFPVIRGEHSFDTIARIRETTQLFSDVFSEGDLLYIHPIKVWQRYSTTMFMPHMARLGEQEIVFKTVTDAVNLSKYFSLVNKGNGKENLNLDSWERYFLKCRNEEDETREIRQNFCRMMLTGDTKVQELFDRFYSMEDYYKVKDKMIGTGRIGGKACGMLIARSIIETRLKEMAPRTEPHDSFYIGAHVFYTFLVHNKLWNLRIEQKKEAGYYSLSKDLHQGIMEGKFPDGIREEFRRMLEYFGQSPIIARSSSFLEDGFGNAFAGKYTSVYCANQGEAVDKLTALEEAIKSVYASTMSQSALEYREMRGLKFSDEQMSILVQRVSGSVQGDYFYPMAGGVGYSYNPYGWSKNIDATRGMLRIVFGLGTKAVDRTETDYPRVIHIDEPQLTVFTNMDDKVKFSQRDFDVIDLKNNKLVQVPITGMEEFVDKFTCNYVAERDFDTERRLREMGRNRKVYFATCHGFAKNESFMKDMEDILRVLREEYDYPVDIEYTVNMLPTGEYVICLLQCRPLQVLGHNGGMHIPEMEEENIFFEAIDTSMGMSQETKFDLVVEVDSKKYFEMPYRRKSKVGDAIFKINKKYKDQKLNMLLMAPGRVGTSSPELGVPLTFSSISAFQAICEYDDVEVGFMPELSFGSHMFQDLVEANIFYVALFSQGHGKSLLNRKLLASKGVIEEIDEEDEIKEVVKVYNIARSEITLFYDMEKGQTRCGIKSS